MAAVRSGAFRVGDPAPTSSGIATGSSTTGSGGTCAVFQSITDGDESPLVFAYNQVDGNGVRSPVKQQRVIEGV